MVSEEEGFSTGTPEPDEPNLAALVNDILTPDSIEPPATEQKSGKQKRYKPNGM